jgi:hypothetical protein
LICHDCAQVSGLKRGLILSFLFDFSFPLTRKDR